MGNTWGNRIKLSIFGESHGPAVGIVIDGLTPGEPVDMGEIEFEMSRRAPGRDKTATARSESDNVIIQSGMYEGRTTGSPLCAMILNENTRSGDYELTKPRPGHADYTAHIKYNGYADMRGGGHFSGRLTAPLVFAGAVAKQILKRRGVSIGARVTRIGAVEDDGCPLSSEQLDEIKVKPFPVLCDSAGENMREVILTAKEEGDSVGGVIEGVAFGVPAGIGDPFFHSIESELAALLFSIPAVKGVEFGEGFNFAAMRGSEANDQYCAEDGKVKLATNHNGGILGGITNGMPLVVRVAVKPTPSINKTQRTVDLSTMEGVDINVRGRHDPCIVPRAVPSVEAAIALCVLDEIGVG